MNGNDYLRRSLKQNRTKESSYDIIPKKTRLNTKTNDLSSSNRYSNVYYEEKHQSKTYGEISGHNMATDRLKKSNPEHRTSQYAAGRKTNANDIIQDKGNHPDNFIDKNRIYSDKKTAVTDVDGMLDQLLKLNRQKTSNNTSEVSAKQNNDMKIEGSAKGEKELLPKQSREFNLMSESMEPPVNINNYMSNPHYIQDIESIESSKLQNIYTRVKTSAPVNEEKPKYCSKGSGGDSINNNYATNNSMNKFSKKLYDELNQYTDSKLQNSSQDLSSSNYKVYEDKSKASFYDILKQKNLIVSPKAAKDKIDEYKTDSDAHKNKSNINTEMTGQQKGNTWQRNLIEIFKNMEGAKKQDESNIEDVNEILKDINLEEEAPKGRLNDSFKEKVGEIDDLLAKLQNSCDEIDLTPYIDKSMGNLRLFNNESSIAISNNNNQLLNKPKQKCPSTSNPTHKNDQADIVEEERQLNIKRHVTESQFTIPQKKIKLLDLMINNCNVPVFNSDDIDTIVQRYFEKRRVKPSRAKYYDLARLITTTINKEVEHITKRINRQHELAHNRKNNIKQDKITADKYLKQKGSEARSKSPIKNKDYAEQYEKRKAITKDVSKPRELKHSRTPSKLGSSTNNKSNILDAKNEKGTSKPIKPANNAEKQSNNHVKNKKRLVKQSEIIEECEDKGKPNIIQSEVIKKHSDTNQCEDELPKKMIDVEINAKDNPYDLAFRIIQDQGLNFVHYNRIVDTIKNIQENL